MPGLGAAALTSATDGNSMMVKLRNNVMFLRSSLGERGVVDAAVDMCDVSVSGEPSILMHHENI